MTVLFMNSFCCDAAWRRRAEGSCARVPDRSRDSGWVVRKTQVSTGMHKAPEQAPRKDCMATDLNEYTQSNFFLYMFV